jgi:hypothetical protein
MSVVGGGRATACRCGELTGLCHVWRERADIPHISGVYFAISMRTINGGDSMRPWAPQDRRESAHFCGCLGKQRAKAGRIFDGRQWTTWSLLAALQLAFTLVR